tara:strand:- start:2975 stop:3571 length:597 start_codon:yes stop_codon:yes gene_type:complete
MKSINPEVVTRIPTKYGPFFIKAYHYLNDQPNLAIHTEGLQTNKPVYVRIHSECMTGDVFGSSKCDCGEQLDFSMKWIQKHEGVIIYLRQEGRGIGLINKLHAYNLQEKGLDTKSANLELGFHEDPRDYTPAIGILKDLKIDRIRLLTNNPMKVEAFEGSQIKVVERVPIEIEPRPENLFYLQTKKKGMRHMLSSKQL